MATIFKLLRARARVAFELSCLTFSGVGYLLHTTYGNEKKKKKERKKRAPAKAMTNSDYLPLTKQQSCLHNILSERLVYTCSFSDTVGSVIMLPPTALGPSAIAIWETSSTTAGSSAAATSQTYTGMLDSHPEMTEMTVGEGVEMENSQSQHFLRF